MRNNGPLNRLVSSGKAAINQDSSPPRNGQKPVNRKCAILEFNCLFYNKKHVFDVIERICC